MAFVITDKCIKCDACLGICPVEAISAGEDKNIIDGDVCISCGSCASECPVEAIVDED